MSLPAKSTFGTPDAHDAVGVQGDPGCRRGSRIAGTSDLNRIAPACAQQIRPAEIEESGHVCCGRGYCIGRVAACKDAHTDPLIGFGMVATLKVVDQALYIDYERIRSIERHAGDCAGSRDVLAALGAQLIDERPQCIGGIHQVTRADIRLSC